MSINIDDLTVGQLKAIRALLGETEPPSSGAPFKVGDKILVRTVTMSQVGRVSEIGPDYIRFEEGGWVADTGRFSEALSSGKLGEFERAPSWFAVGRGAICDVWPWEHDIPKATK